MKQLFSGVAATAVLPTVGLAQKERVKDLWPIQVGVGWEQAKDRGAHKFSTLGQRDDARV